MYGLVLSSGAGVAIASKPVGKRRVGGAGGPELVCGSFGVRFLGRRRSYEPEAIFAADLDAAIFQDERDVLRRAARALVPVARRYASIISAKAFQPTIRPAGRWTDAETHQALQAWRFGMDYAEVVDGFERRIQADFRIIKPHGEPQPDVDPDRVARFGLLAQWGADQLHSAITAAANAAVFGDR